MRSTLRPLIISEVFDQGSRRRIVQHGMVKIARFRAPLLSHLTPGFPTEMHHSR